MHNTWSLSTRLAWRLAAVMLAAVVLAGAAVAWRTIAVAHHLDDSALQSQMRAVVEHLGTGPDGVPRVNLPPALEAAFQSSDGDNLFAVVDASGRMLATSDTQSAAALLPFLPRDRGFFRIPASNAHPGGMLGLLTRAGGLRVVVVQGSEQQMLLLNSLMQEFLENSVWLLLLIGLFTVGIGVLTLRRGLAPLRHVSAAASRVNPSSPGVRLPAEGLPLELLPLVIRVNEGLARLEAGLDAQRRFVGEAAHALRTPLAVLTARLDALPDLPELADEAKALRADVDRMGRLVGQMLDIARLDGLPLDVSPRVSLHAIAVEAISALAPLSIRDGVELELRETGTQVVLHGNHAALVLALTNLIENALAHAPPGSTVDVCVDGGTLAVLDRGPGVAPTERERIFQRFHSGRRQRQLASGAGLGLAIVAEVAAQHGGAIRVEARSGGGSAFVLSLGPAPRGAQTDVQRRAQPVPETIATQAKLAGQPVSA